jgi:hypothetical protein
MPNIATCNLLKCGCYSSSLGIKNMVNLPDAKATFTQVVEAHILSRIDIILAAIRDVLDTAAVRERVNASSRFVVYRVFWFFFFKRPPLHALPGTR